MSFKYYCFSDIHFGVNKVKPRDMLDNIYQYFKHYETKLKDVDVIFIAGDITDKLLVVNSIAFHIVIDFLIFMIDFCSTHNIILRVLEGTPSHDNKQVETFYKTIKSWNTTNFRYIDNISIESILGQTIIYVPDLNPTPTHKIFKEIHRLMSIYSLSSIDVAILHGTFTYQTPYTTEAHYEYSDWDKLIVKSISSGHIHTQSQMNKVFAQGSFNRTRMGEESDKGGYLITINGNEVEAEFLVNHWAVKFITIDIESNKSLESTIDQINCLDLPKNSFVRIRNTNDQFIRDNLNHIRGNLNNLNISREKPQKLLTPKKDLKNDQIGLNNISDLLLEDIKNPDIRNRLNNIIKNTIKEIKK